MDDLLIRTSIFAACVFFSAVSASAANTIKHVALQLPTWKLLLGAASTPVIFLILIGGFFFLPWYVALITIPICWVAAVLTMITISGNPVKRDVYVALYRFGWIADALVLAGAITMIIYFLTY